MPGSVAIRLVAPLNLSHREVPRPHLPDVGSLQCRRIETKQRPVNPKPNSRGRGLTLVGETIRSILHFNMDQCEFKHNEAGKCSICLLYS